MKEIGVEAVVKNTNKFFSDIRKMNKSVDGFADNILDLGVTLSRMGTEQFSDQILDIAGAFSSLHPAVTGAMFVLKVIGNEFRRLGSDIKNVVVGSLKLAIGAIKLFADVTKKVISTALAPFRAMFNKVGNVMERVATIASGIIIANTIRKLADVIKMAGQNALEAAVNFQTMEVRLMGLLARENMGIPNLEDFGVALRVAGKQVGGLMDWVVGLAKISPISTDAIANTLTLATSYGLATNKAKDMTKAVLTFASGMGLTDVAQRRIIENFGQMIQQGKITTMEMRDMGRGAFVPVADLLQRTADLLGMTADEFDGTAASVNAFAKSKGLSSVNTMMEAFIQLTETEFQGAIERMGNTIQGLRQRFANLVNAIVGLNILKPALDLLGQTIGNVFTAIAESERIDFFSGQIGERLSEIVEGLLGELPTVETIVKAIEDALANVWIALGQFQEGDVMGALATIGVPQGLLDFFTAVKEFGVGEKLTGFIDGVVTGFTTLKDWWDENGDTVIEALKVSMGQIGDALGIGGKKDDGISEDTGLGRKRMAEQDKPWYEKLAELDVETITDKIYAIRDAVLSVIEKFQWIMDNWELVKVGLAGIGVAFLLLRYPVLSFLGLLFGLPTAIGVALGLMVAKFVENQPKWFKAGADLMAAFLNGLKNWWQTKVWPWVQNAIQSIKNALASLGIGSLGGKSRTQGPTSSLNVPPSVSTSSVVNNNINFSASYSNTQSPARVRDDIGILLGVP